MIKHKRPSAGGRIHISPLSTTVASNMVSIFPHFVSPCRQCTPIGRESSGSDPALLRSLFYGIARHLSYFPSSRCFCVLFFDWHNELMLCRQRSEGLAPLSSALLEDCSMLVAASAFSCSAHCYAPTIQALFNHLLTEWERFTPFIHTCFKAPIRTTHSLCVKVFQGTVCMTKLIINYYY